MEMMNHYKLAVIIGRYQIPHAGHELLKRKALEIADQVVIILGSAYQARNPRNPFTWQEREQMLLATLDETEKQRVYCCPVRDFYNDERWNAAVKGIVRQYSTEDVVLIGHKKPGDQDTYYLDNFADWDYLGIESVYQIDAAQLRALYFEAEDVATELSATGNLILAPVKQFLISWSQRPEYAEMVAEHQKIKDEKALWDGSPYAVIFSTADAIVRVNAHVLLGKRKFRPGKGLWAIPGGFIEQHERVLVAAIRELKEETCIDLPDKILLQSLKSVKVFDHPKRSCRGRFITHAHFFDLNGEGLPVIKAADDLQEVTWVSVENLVGMEEQIFEDHFHILNEFIQFLDAKKEAADGLSGRAC